MKNAQGGATRPLGKQCASSIVVAFTLLATQGCTAATSGAIGAGCGVGLLAGITLAGVAVAANGSGSQVDSQGNQQAKVDPSAAMLGGAMFGLASGCSAAAVAAAIAAPKREGQHAWSSPEEDRKEARANAERLTRLQAFRAQRFRPAPPRVAQPAQPQPAPSDVPPLPVQPVPPPADVPLIPAPAAGEMQPGLAPVAAPAAPSAPSP
jgi:hypothetical protein